MGCVALPPWPKHGAAAPDVRSMARAKRVSLQLRHRLLILGVGGVVATSAVLVGVGAWQSAKYCAKANENVATLTGLDLEHVTDGMSRLATAVGDSVQESVNASVGVAAGELADRGITFDDQTVSWTATDQFTKKTRPVSLPRMLVGGTWLGQNANMKKATPFVDDVSDM